MYAASPRGYCFTLLKSLIDRSVGKNVPLPRDLFPDEEPESFLNLLERAYKELGNLYLAVNASHKHHAKTIRQLQEAEDVLALIASWDAASRKFDPENPTDPNDPIALSYWKGIEEAAALANKYFDDMDRRLREDD